MDLLVLGAGGLLGSNVVATALGRDQDRAVAGTYHSAAPALDIPLAQLDIRDTDAVEATLETYQPDVVVNCAAMTDVDACETAPERARAVNGRAPGRLAARCADRGIAMVHVSTDYVFDGERDTPYDETATPNPLQVYGDSKRRGERAVLDAAPDALVSRLSFVWGIHRGTGTLTGFPAWVRDRLAAGEATPLFTDQHVTPSRAGAAAATVLDLLAHGADGLVHVAARSCVTPYEFGQLLCEHLDADETLVERGSQAAVDRAAARPRYTCLDVSTVERLLDRPQPTLEEDVAAVAPSL